MPSGDKGSDPRLIKRTDTLVQPCEADGMGTSGTEEGIRDETTKGEVTEEVEAQ
jgi:hypothetical protein